MNPNTPTDPGPVAIRARGSKKQMPIKTAVITAIAVLALLSANAEIPSKQALQDDKLSAAFANPPEDTRPACYWFWLEKQETKEGITKDLEAMSRVGIGRAQIFMIGSGSGLNWKSDLVGLSEPWWENVRHAIREAGRLGVEIGFFNGSGWSQSGGAWVKQEESMRYATSAEIKLQGPQKFSGQVPKPQGMIQEIAVLAYPAPKYEDQRVPEKERTATSVTFESQVPVEIRSVSIQIAKATSGKADLELSKDGKTYRKITSFTVSRHMPAPKVGPMLLAPVVVSIPATRAKYFRLNFPHASDLGEIRVSSALRNGSVYEKQMAKMFEAPQPPFDFYSWPRQPAPDEAGLAVSEKEIRNLSSLLEPDGTLEWEVPPGEWIVERVGMASTGTQPFPTFPEGIGPEVDKINRVPLKHHFDGYVGKLLASMPPEDRKAFKYVVVDSYEQGSQDWTDGFAEVFQKRYGYDPQPWLVALTGRVVGSPDQSDRFLWDLRRLVADRMASEYVGGLRDLSHEKGLSLWLENYGHWGFPAEFLQYGGQSDEIAGEFWVGLERGGLGRMEVRCASSAAHTYGKRTVWAESYTAGPGSAFLNTPRDLKWLGDWSYSEGINQPTLSVYIHQPWEKRGPGMSTWYGSEINRKNTWWNLGMKPWVDYQRKCTVMLQAGNPVADVAYFIGEDTPKMTGIRQPALPKGYDYDYINADVIQKRLSVKEGCLVLPEGTSYRVLVLPSSETMRPEVLRKLKVLVESGATVVGPAPKRSPSLENYPQCDQEVETLVKELWGSGKIRPIADLQSVLPCGPDVVVPDGVVWKHRTDGNREIYFIANQENKERYEKISFRVKEKEPELWWPESGKIESASEFTFQGDRVEVPLHLEPLTSAFVVFEKPTAKDRKPASEQKPAPTVQDITGSWEVQFEEKKTMFDKLIPWPESSDSEIKYFSGEAVYHKEFELPVLKPHLMLDLGEVNAVAKVVLNGQDLGTLWKPPYRVDVSPAIKAGKNHLEITVVHTWHNRIIGDLQPGATPTVFVSFKSRKSTAALQPSGLLGPVRLIQEPQHQ